MSIGSDEKAVQALSALYERNGYSRYRMGKFEEYELYARNRDFLISDSILTFTDGDGRLMALKPDVTLSIVKNGRDVPGGVQKVYYNESVYRVSKGTRSFREINQVGLECIGELDEYCLFEVLLLAAQSLRCVSPRSLLVVSHLGVLLDLLDQAGVAEQGLRRDVIRLISEKNIHGLREVCPEADALCALAKLNGSPDEVLGGLRGLPLGDEGKRAAEELEKLAAALTESGLEDMLRLDFSVVSDISYYNGVVFKGYVESVPDPVLSGGQYDRLLKKLNRNSRAVGFAVYPHELTYLENDGPGLDADTVLLYEEDTDIAEIRSAAETLAADGSKVAVLRGVPEGYRYGKLMKLTAGEVTQIG